MIRIARFPLCMTLATLLCAAGLPQAQTAPLFSRNLIVNGDAEQGTTGWKTSGSFTRRQYGESPTSASPAPDQRGASFFTGGNAALSTAAQEIDLSAAASSIDSGGVGYTLSAFLGGYSGSSFWRLHRDHALVTASFKNASGMVIGNATLGPVTEADRNRRTSLLFRTVSGSLPPGTRRIETELRMVRIDGDYNDGYVDNLSLVLTGVEPPPPPAPKLGKLRITTQPGAQAYLDDSLRGSTSETQGLLVINDLPAGSYRLRLSQTGFKEFTQSVTVAAGETSNVDVKLEPAGPKPLSLKEVEEALQNGVSKKRVGELVKQVGVDFAMSPEREQRLRAAGADDALLYAITQAKK